MRTFSIFSPLLFLLLTFSITAFGDIADSDNGVFILTAKNFNKFVATYPVSVINFHLPWCGHCKKLAPEYEQAAKTLKSIKPYIPLAKVAPSYANKLVVLVIFDTPTNRKSVTTFTT